LKQDKRPIIPGIPGILSLNLGNQMMGTTEKMIGGTQHNDIYNNIPSSSVSTLTTDRQSSQDIKHHQAFNIQSKN
jgi:hypothetical protein